MYRIIVQDSPPGDPTLPACYLMKYLPMSGIGCGVLGWLMETLSGGRTELVKEELELREVWKEREGLRNILEKNPSGGAAW